MFCPKCGTELPELEQLAGKQSSPRRKMTRFLIAIAALLSVALLLGAVVGTQAQKKTFAAPKKVYINLEPSLVRSGLVARLDATERYEVTLVQAEADLAFHILCVEVNL